MIELPRSFPWLKVSRSPGLTDEWLKGIMSKRLLSEHLPRGGMKQRLHLAEVAGASSAGAAGSEQKANDGFESELVLYLLKEWAWGHTSATKIQKMAHKAYNDQVRLLEGLRLSKDRSGAIYNIEIEISTRCSGQVTTKPVSLATDTVMLVKGTPS